MDVSIITWDENYYDSCYEDYLQIMKNNDIIYYFNNVVLINIPTFLISLKKSDHFSATYRLSVRLKKIFF